ncbi:MAG: lipase maturation factor family protein [Acidobacteriaceae bacterium]|nr:lipase maturation factor family protein [Acidobacteriaceae bacterium]MBV9297287.1 lipase maturation factor family protein [Acidobacteriaceae bacterium]MBV9764193.1 lipase maturation factor family protein [Acidobacteriaceae bacterium]
MNLRQAGGKILERLANPGSFELTEALFLRLLGLIYLTAFASFWPQMVGLVGSHGIQPANQVMPAMRSELGARIFFYLPTLFWIGISDSALVWFCVLGCAAALFLVIGFFPRSAAATCFVLYLSLVSVGQPFTAFQWDALLLEAGFLALFAGAPWLIWAYRFLLFRLMFESGAVKLLSHDPNWPNLHALRFHFMTQPLPNPIAYYVYRAPTWMLDAMTAVTLVIELIAPFLLFGPRRVRQIGVALLMFLQVLILLTGNYAFFNLLALALCLWGLDDSTFVPLASILRKRVHPITNRIRRPLANTSLALLIAIGAIELIGMFNRTFETPARGLIRLIAPFQIVNTYGLFAVMTTTRPEIVIEGSNDRATWKEYSFRYKPGELHRGLPLVAPYQPRLDWQMWFAALGTYQENTWVAGLMYRLLLGDAGVIRLLEAPPFTKPPHYIRALLYDYQFTTPADRAKTGAVWQRQLRGTWFGPVSLNGQ